MSTGKRKLPSDIDSSPPLKKQKISSTDNIISTVGKPGKVPKTYKITSKKINKKDYPFSFECSGELVYGQLQTIIYGLNNTKHDNNDSDLCFRVAAKKGKWNLSQICIESDIIGYIAYHSEHDPSELVKIAKETITGEESDLVIPIGRYDWGFSFDNNHDEVLKAAKINPDDGDNDSDDDEDGIDQKFQSNFMVIDTFIGDFIKPWLFKNYKKLKNNIGFYGNNESCGCYVECDDTEYELGWIVNDKDKHPDFNINQTIAIIYDGTYSDLGIEYGDGEDDDVELTIK